MEPIRKILVATDFSEVADHALSAAATFAEKLDAEVVLVHVDRPVSDEAFGDLPPEMHAYAEALRSRLHQETAHAAEALDARARKLRRVTTRIVVGRPAEAIVQEAGRCGADLIVLGTHGRGAVGRAILGSVAHEVLRTAACPVLLCGAHVAA